MKYNNELRKENSQLNKEKIIAAGKRLILDYGYDKVTVSEITRKAGVSKGAFYIHYKTKDDLIQDLIDFTFNDVKKDSIKGTMYERISIFLIESVKKIVKEGLHTAQIWFSDTVKASMYGFEKLKYDEEYMKSILLNEKNEEESLILSKKITSVYYGILIRWCITNGDDNPNKLIKDFVDKDLKRMIGG
jgi:hypothetical protein CLOSPO_01274